MPFEPILTVAFLVEPRGSLPGPSRTITVEPVELPAGPQVPLVPPDPLPVEPEREPAPDKVPTP